MRSFELLARVAGEWRPLASGTTIGARRIVAFAPLEAEAVRVVVTSARLPGALEGVAVPVAGSCRTPPGEL